MAPHRRGHLVPLRFDFEKPRNTVAFVCSRVREGAPALHVVHDPDGDGAWQFLCGGEDHDHGDADEVSLACLECIVASDLSLNEIADLPRGHTAERDRAGGPWTRRDPHAEFIERAVADHGWSVQVIPDGEPAFAYTVGLYRTFRHPELITFGLRPEVMHAILNVCGELIRDGGALPVGAPVDGVLDDYRVLLRPVRARESFTQHLGYAGWFHGGWAFPVMQLVWPDRAGRFPGERGVAAAVAAVQPLLP